MPSADSPSTAVARHREAAKSKGMETRRKGSGLPRCAKDGLRPAKPREGEELNSLDVPRRRTVKQGTAMALISQPSKAKALHRPSTRCKGTAKICEAKVQRGKENRCIGKAERCEEAQCKSEDWPSGEATGDGASWKGFAVIRKSGAVRCAGKAENG